MREHESVPEWWVHDYMGNDDVTWFLDQLIVKLNKIGLRYWGENDYLDIPHIMEKRMRAKFEIELDRCKRKFKDMPSQRECPWSSHKA
ncbi:hypothetical protein FRC02_002384 [Tulasnella sp. 418]|nr:hypothetical protein FRC02_002384 [Tulasnella sp. 418]